MRLRWNARTTWALAAGRIDLAVMSAAFAIFGASLIFQARRWHATPAYHVLLQVLPAGVWGGLFLVSGTAMGAAAARFERRLLVVSALTLAFALTIGWMAAFAARYLTSPDTTPETWVSWAVFLFLLLNAAASVDRVPPPRASREIEDYRRAVDDALSDAEEDQRAILLAALAAWSGRSRDTVSAACASYAQALHAIVPAGAMPSGRGDAQIAIAEARHALRRAEEAFHRATGRSADDPRAG
jgi:hypothetical protein